MENRFRIRIGEPWDYEDKHGPIYGMIVRIVSPEVVVFQSNEPREFDGHKGQIFILHTRHVDETFDFKTRDYIASVGGFLYLGNNYECEDYSSLEKNSIYVIIGSLERI